MTTNKPGTVNQRPLYGCTSCFEDYTWPAGDLRVHDGECWCDPCWDERRWEFPDLPSWNDLEPYTPAPQPAEQKPGGTQLLKALERIANMDSMSYHSLDSAKITARAALAAHRKQRGDV